MWFSMQNLHSLSDKKKLDKTPLALKRCDKKKLDKTPLALKRWPIFSSLLNIKLFLYKIVIIHQNRR
jgi:hypothetical protein